MSCVSFYCATETVMDDVKTEDPSPAPCPDKSSDEYDRSQLPHLLKIYYKSLFPYDKYFEWLQYGKSSISYKLVHDSIALIDDMDTFSHREFSFTLEDDVYVRYQSFDSREALQEGIRKANPYKIDIGAIFSEKVRLRTCVQTISDLLCECTCTLKG